jgi:exosome complex RNA-binding protein Rrp4
MMRSLYSIGEKRFVFPDLLLKSSLLNNGFGTYLKISFVVSRRTGKVILGSKGVVLKPKQLNRVKVIWF